MTTWVPSDVLSEAFEHNLALGLAAFQQCMGAAQVGGIDAAKVLADRGTQGARIDQPGDTIEQEMLLDHVRGLEQRAGVHELPVQ